MQTCARTHARTHARTLSKLAAVYSSWSPNFKNLSCINFVQFPWLRDCSTLNTNFRTQRMI